MTVAPTHAAASPWSMPWADWKDVLTRSWKEASDDNVGLIAAGVAFLPSWRWCRCSARSC